METRLAALEAGQAVLTAGQKTANDFHQRMFDGIDDLKREITKISTVQDEIRADMKFEHLRTEKIEVRLQSEREARLDFEKDIKTSVRNAKWLGIIIGAVASFLASLATIFGYHVTTPPHH